MPICDTCDRSSDDVQPTDITLWREEGELEPGIPEAHLINGWDFNLCASCRRDLAKNITLLVGKEPDRADEC